MWVSAVAHGCNEFRKRLHPRSPCLHFNYAPPLCLGSPHTRSLTLTGSCAPHLRPLCGGGWGWGGVMVGGGGR